MLYDWGLAGGWQSALEHIAGAGAVGAFIDFLIGKAGQKRLKSILETWWIRLSYVDLKNFGAEEAAFAVTIFMRVFGKTSWSLGRFASILLLFAVATIVSYIILHQIHSIVDAPEFGESLKFTLIDVLATLVSVWASLWITLLWLRLTVKFCRFGSGLGFFYFLAANVVQYIFLCTWVPYLTAQLYEVAAQVDLIIMPGPSVVVSELDYLKTNQYALKPAFLDLLLPNSIFNPMHSLVTILGFRHLNLINVLDFANSILMFGVSGLRMVIAAAFLISFILRPLKGSISLLWARLVESDRPTFTLVFTATTALSQILLALLRK